QEVQSLYEVGTTFIPFENIGYPGEKSVFSARLRQIFICTQLESRAGFSFGNRTNGLKFVAQVIGLRGNGAMQRLSEHLPHSPTSSVAAAARPVQKSEIALPSSRIYKP
ncbi:MAG: hypothetical protein U0J82_03490, partial [Collinsella sp.]|nr:hypothetical protein [Collinsella sp.]